MAASLNSEFPGLADHLERATAALQRAAALASARMAVLRTGLRDRRLSAAEAAASDGRFGESPEREALASLVDALDEAAWSTQEALRGGTATEEAYVRAFRKARAASALFCALGEQPLEAAVNGIYEAHHALGDSAALSELLNRVLGSPAV